MVCAPVRSIIPSLKLGDYLSIQAHKPCSISHLYSILSHNLAATSPFQHILFSPAVDELARDTPVHYRYLILLHISSSVKLFSLFFLSLCPVKMFLLDQKTLRHGQTKLISVS